MEECVFHAGKLFSFLCLFVSGLNKSNHFLIFWFGYCPCSSGPPIRLRRPAEQSTVIVLTCFQSWCLEVLRGSHNFLFNKPWCIFVTLFCFITLWIHLNLLVYRKQSGQSATCIQKATRQIHGEKKHAPFLLPQWTKCNWEPGPVSLPTLVSHDFSHLCKVWYELILVTVSQLYTMYIKVIPAHFQDRELRFSKTTWLTHCSLTIHLWSVND